MYKAQRLPIHAGIAAWNAILPTRDVGLALRASITTDFVVIGAGFAGLSAARRLLQLNAKAKVVVLEAGEIGEAASGRNSGFMIDLPHELTSEDYAGEHKSGDRDLIEQNRAAISFARDAVEEYDIDRNYFDQAGKINGAISERSHSANISYANHLRDLNESFEFLDKDQMLEITGSSYYVSGLYTPGTVMLQPAGYVRGLADGLKKSLSIYEHTPATQIEKSGPDWQVTTPEGSVTAGRVILANNGHLESFGFKRHRLMHVFLFAMMTPSLDQDALAKLGGAPRWGVTPSDPMGTTMRRIDTGQGGNRIVTRTFAQFQPNMQTSERHMKHAVRVMHDKFNARFPKLATVPMEYAWSGHLCLSRNSVSVTGTLDDGIYAACCQNGLGTTRGTLTGIAAAEMASGFESVISRFFGAEVEPNLLPPPPISTLGANAVLRWKERKARFE